jgi:putative ABC transport system permease protein
MRLHHILRSRLRSLSFRGRRDADLTENLQFHLDNEVERLHATGMPREAARLQAFRLLGVAGQIDESSRAARGAAFVDDTVRDVLSALRTFKRAPVVALTIVATVAVGLGLVAAVFTVLNALVFRVDAVPDVQEMYAVERAQAAGEPAGFTRDRFDALRRETNFFSGLYAQVGDVDSGLDGQIMYGTFVTGNCFQVLQVGAAIGRALTPADDEPLAGQPVMVLSHRGWDRLFARDPAVLGRRLLVNGITFEIVGVMPDDFRGLAVVASDDYWAPLSMLGRVSAKHQGGAATIGLDIIGRLKPGVSREMAVAQLAAWDAVQASGRPIERGRLTLVPRRGTVPQPLEALPATGPLFFAFGLILLIGCANVANLLLARGVARQREIGIQLALGATRRRIVRQLMTESLLLALLAAAAGFVISRVALAAIVNALMTSMPPDIGDVRLLVPDADWRVLLFLIAGAVVSTIAFALAPALHATRIEPIGTIRGDVAGEPRPGRARNFLVGLQVSASALLLIAAGVFLRSAFASATYDAGVRTSDTLAVQIVHEPNRKAIIQALTADPSVVAVAASWPDLALRPAFAESGGSKARIAYRLVSPDYFSVLDIRVVRGRAFAPDERTPNLSVAIVSETTARVMWPNANPIGQVIRVDPDPSSEPPRPDEPSLVSQAFEVAGVVRDVAGLRIMPLSRAVVYVPTSAETPRTSLVARVHGNPELARQKLLNRLIAIDPDMARQVTTLRTLARIDTYFLQLAFWLTMVLGGLALALTLSGLFSVLSYLVAQRTREIGVRMALGATTRDVTRLVLSQSVRPVGVGLFIGGGSAAGLAALLLATPAAAAIGAIVHVLDPVAYAVSLLVIIAACMVAAAVPATRAARVDPAVTLRQD